ncbi:unnamed protein product [Caenorhabditis bovis]|uniref:Uncharacterized protein n=1 Tax=Caenorhabditis bovis TaxID=2654633 RepID=A0A8S1EGM2_9PELO|nr:unnamed protein product [Caenorhabditis bovis]
MNLVFFICSTIVHLLSFLFNGLLIYLIVTKKLIHSVIYLSYLIVCEIIINITQILIAEVPYIFVGWQTAEQYKLWYMLIVTITNMVAFEMLYVISFVGSLHRFWVVWRPGESAIFATRRLFIYLTTCTIINIGFFTWLWFHGCFIRMNFTFYRRHLSCTFETYRAMRNFPNFVLHIAAFLNFYCYSCINFVIFFLYNPIIRNTIWKMLAKNETRVDALESGTNPA